MNCRGSPRRGIIKLSRDGRIQFSSRYEMLKRQWAYFVNLVEFILGKGGFHSHRGVNWRGRYVPIEL